VLRLNDAFGENSGRSQALGEQALWMTHTVFLQ
jgi:hypothetical protein